MERRVYTPDSNIRHPWVMLREMFRDIRLGQDLAMRLTIRDIKAQYRQSILGLLWAFIIPIANTLVWIMLNASGIVSLDDTGLPYPVYVFSGTMIWSMFLESMQAPIQKITANKSMIAKVNFPREAIPMSAFYQSLFNTAIKVVILVVALAVLGYLGGFTLALVPFAAIGLVLAGTTLGLFLVPIAALYTDISKGIPLLMQFLMYTTPVIYAIPQDGIWRTLIENNPLTPLIVVTRNWLTGTPTDLLGPFLYVLLGTLVLLAIFLIVFRLAIPILVERMNA